MYELKGNKRNLKTSQSHDAQVIPLEESNLFSFITTRIHFALFKKEFIKLYSSDQDQQPFHPVTLEFHLDYSNTIRLAFIKRDLCHPTMKAMLLKHSDRNIEKRGGGRLSLRN